MSAAEAAWAEYSIERTASDDEKRAFLAGFNAARDALTQLEYVVINRTEKNAYESVPFDNLEAAQRDVQYEGDVVFVRRRLIDTRLMPYNTDGKS